MNRLFIFLLVVVTRSASSTFISYRKNRQNIKRPVTKWVSLFYRLCLNRKEYFSSSLNNTTSLIIASSTNWLRNHALVAS